MCRLQWLQGRGSGMHPVLVLVAVVGLVQCPWSISRGEDPVSPSGLSGGVGRGVVPGR